MIYAKKVLRDRKIPFEITAPREPFDSPANQRALAESMAQLEQGKTVTKTWADLEAAGNE